MLLDDSLYAERPSMISTSNKIHWRWFVSVVVLSIINLWLFWPGDLYFLNDDLLHIPLTDQGHFFQTNSVRPVHELLVKLDLLIYGEHAYGYHITALLLNFLVCIQLFDLSFLLQNSFLRIERQRAINASLLAVILFLLYPQSSESYAWILGRAPILSAVFLLITLRMFFGKLNCLTCCIGVLSFAVTLFTYEQCILIPALLLWVAHTSKDRRHKNKRMMFVSLLFIAAIGYIFARKIITNEVVGNYEGSNFLSADISNLTANLFRFTSRLFLHPASNVLFIYSLIFFCVLMISTFILFKKDVHLNREYVIFFTSAILILLLPVLSLGISIHSFESSRYLYLPSLFLVIAISIACVQFYEDNRQYRKVCIILFSLISLYWLSGKLKASRDYKAASLYARKTNETVLKHFSVSTDTLYIDTLQLSIHHLPVFRLGFKTGVKWFNSNIDTNKILVQHAIDANAKKED